jgi:hypothetical protein
MKNTALFGFFPAPATVMTMAMSLALLAGVPMGAHAQLSAPLAAGSGAGVHSPDSPIAPLPARADTVSWDVLTSVKLKDTRNGMRPAFEAPQIALDQKVQKVQGFMMPLDPGERQKHFLLTSVPTSCSFCTPGGPESMIEVKTKTPVKYTQDAVVVEGRFAVLRDDPYGLYYRLTEAVQTK